MKTFLESVVEKDIESIREMRGSESHVGKGEERRVFWSVRGEGYV